MTIKKCWGKFVSSSPDDTIIVDKWYSILPCKHNPRANSVVDVVEERGSHWNNFKTIEDMFEEQEEHGHVISDGYKMVVKPFEPEYTEEDEIVLDICKDSEEGEWV